MSRTRDFFVNTTFTGLHHVLVIVSGFIIPKIMLIYYGSDIFGLVTSITQFVNYFMVVEAGLATAGVVALYKPIVDNNFDKISGIVSATRQLYYTTGHLFLSLVIILSLTYPLFVTLKGLSYVDIALLTVFIGASGTLDFYTMSRFRVILTAYQKVYIIAIGNIIFVIMNILITYICAKLQLSVLWLKLVVLSAVIVRSLFLRSYVARNYSNINHKAPAEKSALKGRWDALYLQILGAIHSGTPIVLITILCSLTEVSVYAVFNIVIAGIIGLLSLFSTSLFPSFGDIIARGDKKLLQRSFEKFEILYYLLLAVVGTCLFVLLQNFVILYTSDVNNKAEYINPLLGFLMIVNMILHNVKNPQGMLVLSAGLFKETRWQTTTQGLLAVVCGAVLGYYFGVKGIVTGIIISNIYRDIDLMLFIPKKLTGLSWKFTAGKILIMFLAIGLFTLLLNQIIAPADSWGGWLLSGVICFITALGGTTLLFYIFFTSLIKESFQQLKSIF